MIRKFFLRFWRTLRSAFFLKCTVVVNLLVYLVCCCFFFIKRDYFFFKDIYFHFFKYFAFETASQIWCRHFSWWPPSPKKKCNGRSWLEEMVRWLRKNVRLQQQFFDAPRFLLLSIFNNSVIFFYFFFPSSVCVRVPVSWINHDRENNFFFLFHTVCDPFINRTYLYTQQMEKRDFFFPCYYWSTNRIRFPSVGFQKGTRPFSRWMTHQARYTSEESVCNLLLCVLTQTNPNRDGLVTPNLSSNSIWHFFFFLFYLAGLNQ